MAELELDPQMDELASSYIHDPRTLTSIVLPQFRHRQALVNKWSPSLGSRILDIGCGQGECSLVLAQFVGPTGHVTGIDSAPADYGGPYTVGQAQAHIKSSLLGQRIDFERASAVGFFEQSGTQNTFDAAVLCHSLWYFDRVQNIKAMFQTLAEAGIPQLYLAEYALQASLLEQVPHVLAAQAQKRLVELQRPREFSGTRERNIRSAVSPEGIVTLAREAGWKVKMQGVITPGSDLLDGHYEAKYVTMDYFLKDVESEGLDEEGKSEVLSYVPKVKKAMKEVGMLGGQRMRTMDVWWAVLEL